MLSSIYHLNGLSSPLLWPLMRRAQCSASFRAASSLNVAPDRSICFRHSGARRLLVGLRPYQFQVHSQGQLDECLLVYAQGNTSQAQCSGTGKGCRTSKVPQLDQQGEYVVWQRSSILSANDEPVAAGCPAQLSRGIEVSKRPFLRFIGGCYTMSDCFTWDWEVKECSYGQTGRAGFNLEGVMQLQHSEGTWPWES